MKGCAVSDTVVIESNKRFSESCLWAMQRDYFHEQGINAWVKKVPFYVTSNPSIANCYANLIVNFVQDWIEKHPEASTQPFYVLELGTGSGCFSFYTRKRITALCDALGIDAPIIYVMTDMTENNLKYWDSHPALAHYFEEGTLDYAVFDMEVDETITLQKSGLVLSPETIANPLMVCANYIFDTVSHDTFTIEGDSLEEAVVTLSTTPENMDHGKPKDWNAVNVAYQQNAIDLEQYYADPDFNAVLQSYIGRLHDSHFLMPIAGLRAIRKLMHMSGDRLMLISSDKSYSHIEELDNLDYPSMAFHGSFSMMVNYDAINQYFKIKGGDSFMQSRRKGLKTLLFTLGADMVDLPRTQLAAEEHIEGFSPADYFMYHRKISDIKNKCDADILASHLSLTRYDPYMFNRLAPILNDVAVKAALSTQLYLKELMPKIAENFYWMPESSDVMFHIGLFFHTLKDYGEALDYYDQSLALYGDVYNTCYNIALCQYYLGESEKALPYFKKALSLDPTKEQCREWIEYVQQENTKPL